MILLNFGHKVIITKFKHKKISSLNKSNHNPYYYLPKDISLNFKHEIITIIVILKDKTIIIT